jgi:hypothetical protein
MNWLAWLILIVIFLTILSKSGARERERQIEKMFGGRVLLDDGEFYERNFAVEGIPMFIVLGVKRIFEKELNVDLSRLLPDDEIASRLKYFWEEDEWADVDILQGCEKEFGIKLTQADVKRMTTFRKFVRVVWEKVQQKSG